MKGVVLRLKKLDLWLFRKIFRLKWTPMTPVMKWFTVAGSAGALWGFIAAGAFLVTGFEPWRLLVPWAAIFLSWSFAEAIKHLFDRSRPSMADKGVLPLIKTPSSSSFPSGHSATAAAGALTLSAVYPALVPALVPAAILTVLSRVYLGVHYPLDVLAGVLIGVATSSVLLLIW